MRRSAGPSQFSDDDLRGLNASFERESAGPIVPWAVEDFSGDLCLTTSLTDLVLIDVVCRADPANCRSELKIEQLNHALRGERAWMSAVRQVDSPDRRDTPLVSSIGIDGGS